MTAGWTDPRTLKAELENGYLERVTEDIRPILGPDVELDEVELVTVEPDDHIDDRPRVGLLARYRLGTTEFETTAPGETLIDAHRQLRARLVIDRVRMSFTREVERDLRR